MESRPATPANVDASGLPFLSPPASLPPPPPPAPSPVGGSPRRLPLVPAWLAPAAVGAAGLAGCVLVAIRDPHISGSYATCPFLAVTGYDCAGCGLLRATNAALHGNLGQALDHNIFWPVVMVLIVGAYLRWVKVSLGRRVRPITMSNWSIAALYVVVFGFWIVRNLGGPFAYLEA